MSPDISSFLRTFRQAHAGDVAVETLDSQMAKKRKERDEAKTKANEVKKDLKKLRNQKARSLKKTKLASSEELLEALANRAVQAERKAASSAATKTTEPVPPP